MRAFWETTVPVAATTRRADAPRPPGERRGFTLVELLVAMAIILILAGMTLAALNIGANADRIPGGSRQTQSMILGARDRAIYAGEPRGVRLVLDPNTNIVDASGNPMAASSFVFIGAPQSYGEGRGTVTVQQYDHDSDPLTPPIWIVIEDNPRLSSWGRMVQRRLLDSGARITFGDESRWYTLGSKPVDIGDGTSRHWSRLTRSYAGKPPGESMYSGLDYRVTLAPSVLPGEEPRTLPQGVVIDLESLQEQGRLPRVWWNYDTGSFIDPNALDIMFNERGTIHGPLASMGVLPLPIVDAVDMQKGFRIRVSNMTPVDVDGDGVPDERESPESIVAIYTNSGTVAVAPPDETETDSTGGGEIGVRADAFYLAETGGEG